MTRQIKNLFQMNIFMEIALLIIAAILYFIFNKTIGLNAWYSLAIVVFILIALILAIKSLRETKNGKK